MVVIIGGGKGIGSALVDAHAAGSKVVFTYHQTRPSRISKRNVQAIQLDLRSRVSIEEFVGRFKRKSISTLIYVSSTFFSIPFGRVGKSSQSKDKEWNELFDVNLKAAYFLCEKIEAKLGDGADLQFFGDVWTSKYSLEFFPYAAAKAGLSVFVKSLARAWAPRVRVNEIRLGCATPPSSFSVSEQRRWAKEKSAKIPMGRLCGTDSIVRTSKFLASETYMTGASIDLDGGLSI